jgi:hypothetical protein
MTIDRIIAEVRQAREELARRCNHDLRAMIDTARGRQAASGRKVVSFPPKPARTRTSKPMPKQQIQPTGVADEG